MNDAASVVRLVDGSRHVLTDARATIGRGDSESICLPVASVSRLHAAIDRTPHGYLLRDLQSRNGVFVNGQRVGAGGHALRDGDEIVIGGAECLRFVDPLGTPIGPGIGRLHGVWIDPDSRTVWVDSQRLDPPLSDRQLQLLELLDVHANEIVSREMIIDQVWSDVAADGVSAEALDSLIKRVRARLRPLQIHGEYIEVFRGRGVRLNRLAPARSRGAM